MSQGKDRSDFQITDRRFWVENEALLEQAPEPEKKYPTYVEELKARTELAEQKLKERIAELERDNEAFRARLDRQLEKRLEQEKLLLLQSFLDVVDNLERALKAFSGAADAATLSEGVRLNLDLFLSRLRAAGIEPVDCLNQPFDPHIAEAVSTVPVDDPEQDQRVVEVVQPGYRLGETLLRPALVTVARYVPG